MIDCVTYSIFMGVKVRCAKECGLIFGEDMALAAGFADPTKALALYVKDSDKVTNFQVRLEDGTVVTPVLLTKKGYFDLCDAIESENDILFGKTSAMLMPILQSALNTVIRTFRKHLTPELEEKVIAALHDEAAFNDLLREYNRLCREEKLGTKD